MFAQRDGYSLRAVCRAEFGKDRGKVFLYAVFADVKLLGDVGVGESARDRRKYV